MSTGLWFRLLVISCILAGCLAGAAGAASLGTDWKERAPDEGPYLGVMITPDASLVYAGGENIDVRSWDREIHWGSRPARVAALSDDGKRVVIGEGNKLSVLDNKGIENWSRDMERPSQSHPKGRLSSRLMTKGTITRGGRTGI